MTHLPYLIMDLALILGAAAIVTLLFKKLKQPLVLGYIIAGFFVGPHFHWLPTVYESSNIQIWGEIGVIFLLFSLGLEFSFKKLIKVGAPASITAVFEVVAMIALGFGTGKLLGWNNMDSLFLGGILSISSTTIILRAFDELNVKTQRFASLVFGALIVEDLVAIVLLVLLSTLALSQQFAGTEMLLSVLKLVFFLVIWFASGIFFLPSILKKTKKLMNEETLLVVSLSLCLLMVWFASAVGFSPALGAFIMGSILAETTQAEKIEHLVKPVKDLFGAIFFVSVGMMIEPAMLVKYAGPIALITVITIVGKVTSTTFGALLSGQSLQTSVQAGFSLAQIGEFSFIIATLGLTLKVTSGFLYPIAVAVSAVTTLTTPFLIKSSKPFYKWLERILPDKVLNALSGMGSKAKESLSAWNQVVRSTLVSTFLISMLLVCIVMVSAEYALPYIKGHFSDGSWVKWATAFLTLLLMLPFLYALAVRNTNSAAYREVIKSNRYNGRLNLIHFFRLIIAGSFIGFLMHRFFSFEAGLISVIVIGVIIGIFNKKIRKFYDRIEARFISNFNERELAAAEKNRSELAPWDAHIAPLELHPESPVIGKTLLELHWREQLGINVVLIKRGDISITAPGRDERVYPGDELFVLGSDAQIKRLQAIIRPVKHPDEENVAPIDVVLREFVIDEHSPLLNKTIRGSGIREKIKGIVVGVERIDQRILNPESFFEFQLNDVVFVVGEARLIHKLLHPPEKADR
ncbi:sodium:proton antiporter [Pseudoflavitalea sp. G-6-1-2]|uniref:cation:proton antiporter n=1 Tax=Pseudoflavitalea sp. G-6-1-2 TaxID=2728841 RepID=UPI00146B9B58|nr:cation:proton antiporter [Pseudoflavitalea sp. G-6-1-2]NML21900.1 sodium:proton antiporter [Pseudoflavitalea sp. G-6-1-2]